MPLTESEALAIAYAAESDAMAKVIEARTNRSPDAQELQLRLDYVREQIKTLQTRPAEGDKEHQEILRDAIAEALSLDSRKAGPFTAEETTEYLKGLLKRAKEEA
jgi:polyhydroxyalkanoate synthesis regulator phasin